MPKIHAVTCVRKKSKVWNQSTCPGDTMRSSYHQVCAMDYDGLEQKHNIGAYMRMARHPWLPILPFLLDLLPSHMVLAASQTTQGKQGGTGTRQSVGRSAVDDNFPSFFSHFYVRSSPWNVGNVDYHIDFSSSSISHPFPPSSTALCRRMVLTQLVLIKLYWCQPCVFAAERVADWTGPKGIRYIMHLQVYD